MQYFYSRSTGGFYGGSAPNDAVSITEAQHAALLAAQAAGKIIQPDANGNPIAVDPSTLLTLDQLKAAKAAQMKGACALAIVSGCASLALGATYNYPTDRDSQTNMLSHVADAQLDPAASFDFWCGDASGAWALRAHSAAQIIVAWKDIRTWIKSQQSHYADKLTAVNAAADPAAVAAVQW